MLLDSYEFDALLFVAMSALMNDGWIPEEVPKIGVHAKPEIYHATRPFSTGPFAPKQLFDNGLADDPGYRINVQRSFRMGLSPVMRFTDASNSRSIIVSSDIHA